MMRELKHLVARQDQRQSVGKPKPWRRPGMTLVELLVVMSVMVLLAALVAPTLQPMMADRKVQEASRQVHVFLSKAQARAIELQRPVSVWIERAGPGINYSTQLFLAESPQSYRGDTLGAEVSVQPNLTVTNANGSWKMPFVFSPRWASRMAPYVVRTGDSILLNHRGNRYRLENALAADGDPNTNEWWIHSAQNPPEAKPSFTVTVPFQIERQPEKTSAKPLTLPTGVVIDLWYSGLGSEGFGEIVDGGNAGTAPTAAGARSGLGVYDELVDQNDLSQTPVLITFDPSGSVQSFFLGRRAKRELDGTPIASVRVTSVQKLYLLIGRIENTVNATVNTSAADFWNKKVIQSNLADPTTLWVSVEPNTGKITTADNAPRDYQDDGIDDDDDYVAGDVTYAREFTRSGQSNTGG